jgi:hypothetical protein
MYILLLCPLHSSLSLASPIFCTKFYVVNCRQDKRKEGVISTHVFIITKLYVHLEQK